MPLQHALTTYLFSVWSRQYSLMDIPCTGIWPSLPWSRQQPVWHRVTWRPQPHLSQQPRTVQPLSLLMLGFAWEENAHFTSAPIRNGMAAHSQYFLLYLPGHNFSGGRSTGVDSQWVCFFCHGWTDETLFKCEHCNRTGLLAHTQDLAVGTSSQDLLEIEEGW